MNMTIKDKKVIAKWINETWGHPEYDGYLGTVGNVPEEIMIVYRKMYPTAWRNYTK